MSTLTRVAVLAACAALCAAACSSKEDAGGEPPPTDPPPAAPPPGAPIPVAPIDASTAPAPPAEPEPDPEPEPEPEPGSKTAEPAGPDQGPPSNLHVLPKSWSRSRVEDYMKQQVAKALGVKCKYCHDTRDFAKDTEHKTEARAMMRLTNHINADFFDGKARVSCMTCHLGNKEPAGEQRPGRKETRSDR